MPYPEPLLPKVAYKEEIVLDELTHVSPDFYLVRISALPIEDPADIRIRELCHPTKEFVGLSTNLLGVFGLVHLPFKPVGRPQVDYWVRTDGSIDPADIDYIEVAGRNPIFIRITQLHDTGFSATKQVAKEPVIIDFKARVQHKPTKPNYWHFEVKVFNTANQVELDRDHLPDWAKNAIKKFVEIDICHKASGIPPASFSIIPRALFTDS